VFKLRQLTLMTLVQELGCRCREHLYSYNDVQHTVLKCCQVTHFLVFIWFLIVCRTGGNVALWSKGNMVDIVTSLLGG
jgi:hypothetical protein